MHPPSLTITRDNAQAILPGIIQTLTLGAISWYPSFHHWTVDPPTIRETLMGLAGTLDSLTSTLTLAMVHINFSQKVFNHYNP